MSLNIKVKNRLIGLLWQGNLNLAFFLDPPIFPRGQPYIDMILRCHTAVQHAQVENLSDDCQKGLSVYDSPCLYSAPSYYGGGVIDQILPAQQESEIPTFEGISLVLMPGTTANFVANDPNMQM